ncbi:hypothetical protein BDN70DRAFT_895491 [Pholiota conissans]|uniref:Uncharacterized protein n=1 Tax=Pholiota conissans TaxID=109636 RepID=A0A9P6CTT3_9AGAR|nr:hypothetical protein BDN70DRAFT_895491 [Pholiota conissans]
MTLTVLLPKVTSIAFAADQFGPQVKTDIENSTLWAQISANAQYDRATQSDQWYDYYGNVLRSIGWEFQNFNYGKNILSDTPTSVDQIVIKYLDPLLFDSTKQTVFHQLISDLKADINNDFHQGSNYEFNVGVGTQDSQSNVGLSILFFVWILTGNINLLHEQLQIYVGAFKYTFDGTVTNVLTPALTNTNAQLFSVNGYEAYRQEVLDKFIQNVNNQIGDLNSLPPKTS